MNLLAFLFWQIISYVSWNWLYVFLVCLNYVCAWDNRTVPSNIRTIQTEFKSLIKNIIRAHRTTIEMFLKLIAKIFYLLKCWKFRFRQNFKFTLDSIKLNRFLWIITLRNVRMKDPCFKESKRPLLQVDLKILGGVNREAKI